MPFLKLRCERAYNTGAIRTSFTVGELAARLTRQGIPARALAGRLEVETSDETFVFDSWQGEVYCQQVGWLRFTTSGDIGGLSWKLARIGVRHRLELSRPRDLQTDDVRSVTRYAYRWDSRGRRRPDQVAPEIHSYDEAL